MIFLEVSLFVLTIFFIAICTKGIFKNQITITKNQKEILKAIKEKDNAPS